MTERKKAFIADAIGEIADEFIAEAVEYQKAKPIWKYTRELVTVAACAAVLLVSFNVIRLIPIGSTDTATNEAGPENMQEAIVLETITTDVTGTLETMLENESAALNDSVKQENVEQIENSVDNLNKVVEEESIQTSSCVQWMSAEEILALDVEIFLGTVTDMETCHVTGGMERYVTVATVEVEDSIRSALEKGDTCRIYLPFAKIGGLTTTTSNIGDLEKLGIGSRAIFMPHKTTEEKGAGNGDVWLSYLDFSDYYFGEGMRFLFLETESGTSYETSVYEVEGGNTASLEEIAEYLRGVLEK